MSTLTFLTPQVYQASESIMINQRVHPFHDFGLSYFYHIKVMSWSTADYLKWIYVIYVIYVKTKSGVYMCLNKEKLAQNISGLAK